MRALKALLAIAVDRCHLSSGSAGTGWAISCLFLGCGLAHLDDEPGRARR